VFGLGNAVKAGRWSDRLTVYYYLFAAVEAMIEQSVPIISRIPDKN